MKVYKKDSKMVLNYSISQIILKDNSTAIEPFDYYVQLNNNNLKVSNDDIQSIEIKVKFECGEVYLIIKNSQQVII